MNNFLLMCAESAPMIRANVPMTSSCPPGNLQQWERFFQKKRNKVKASYDVLSGLEANHVNLEVCEVSGSLSGR